MNKRYIVRMICKRIFANPRYLITSYGFGNLWGDNVNYTKLFTKEEADRIVDELSKINQKYKHYYKVIKAPQLAIENNKESLK